jgi:hypothetical protein
LKFITEYPDIVGSQADRLCQTFIIDMLHYQSTRKLFFELLGKSKTSRMMPAMSVVVFHDLLYWSKLAMICKANTTGEVMSPALFLFDLDLVMLT